MSVPCQRIEYKYRREPFPIRPSGSGLPTSFPNHRRQAIRGFSISLAKYRFCSALFC
jgi:hypothetical protein